MATVTILGVKISCLTPASVQQWLTSVVTQPSSTQPRLVFTPNPEILVLAQQQPSFRDILNSADLSLPDGQGIVWFSQHRIHRRITGVDTMFFLLDLAQRYHLSVGFVLNPHGLSKLEDITQLMQHYYPGVAITTEPDILFVGLGAPQQEYWAYQHQSSLNRTKLILTVGGGLDFLTGQQRRAPIFFQKMGVEWLWRLYHQPQRLRRIINATIVFPYYCWRYKN